MYYEGNRKCDSLYTEGFEFSMEVENLTDQKKDAEVSCQIYGYDGSTCLEKTEKFSVKNREMHRRKFLLKHLPMGFIMRS